MRVLAGRLQQKFCSLASLYSGDESVGQLASQPTWSQTVHCFSLFRQQDIGSARQASRCLAAG